MNLTWLVWPGNEARTTAAALIGQDSPSVAV